MPGDTSPKAKTTDDDRASVASTQTVLAQNAPASASASASSGAASASASSASQTQATTDEGGAAASATDKNRISDEDFARVLSFISMIKPEDCPHTRRASLGLARHHLITCQTGCAGQKESEASLTKTKNQLEGFFKDYKSVASPESKQALAHLMGETLKKKELEACQSVQTSNRERALKRARPATATARPAAATTTAHPAAATARPAQRRRLTAAAPAPSNHTATAHVQFIPLNPAHSSSSLSSILSQMLMGSLQQGSNSPTSTPGCPLHPPQGPRR